MQSNGVTFSLEIEAAADFGDGTVPALRSASKAAAQGAMWEQTGYDHQGALKAPHVLTAVLYAMIGMDQGKRAGKGVI